MVTEIELGEFDLDSFMNESEESESVTVYAGEGASRQIVFVIDASNSMQGHKIGSVNDCVNNILSKLRSLDRNQEDPISISVIGFSSRLFKWTESFVRASDFKYSYVEMVDGVTDINAALQELIMLTNNMEKDTKKYVILFSDGLTTEDYTENLAHWKQAELYSDIVKIAVAFDDDLCDSQSVSFFENFVGSGMVIPITDQERLLSPLLG